MNARPLINSLEFAQKGLELTGVISLSELPRLCQELLDDNGQLSYQVQGGANKKGEHSLHLVVTGKCQLTCQRCLEAMEYLVQIDTHLMLRTEAELALLDGEEEEFESILAETQLDLLDLLEEEVLLSLPIAPKHDVGVCQTTSGEKAGQDTHNPFAVLASLKRN